MMDIDDVQVPSSTKTMIVFPWDSSSKKFDRKTYTPEQTDGRATLDQVDQFLNIMDAVVNEKSYTAFFDATINVLKWGIPVISIFYAIEGSLTLSVKTITLILFFWVVAWQVGTIIMKQKKKSKGEKIKEGLKAALAQKSLKDRYQEFDVKQLRWKISSDFPKWIELHKDYEKEDPKETSGKDQKQGEKGKNQSKKDR